MNILSSNGKRLINYNNIISLGICEVDCDEWRIVADRIGSSYYVLGVFHTEQECQNTFNRLCDKIATCREHDTIDLGDLWD